MCSSCCGMLVRFVGSRFMGTGNIATGGDDDVVNDCAEELIATASRDYCVRIQTFAARLVAKFGGVVGRYPAGR
jgi:hypothetical protein